jgi:hypothetical protein
VVPPQQLPESARSTAERSLLPTLSYRGRIPIRELSCRLDRTAGYDSAEACYKQALAIDPENRFDSDLARRLALVF